MAFIARLDDACGPKGAKCGTLHLLSDAEAALESQLELLFDAGRVEVLLEDEEVAFLVEHDELTVAERDDAVDPEGDVSAGRLNYLDLRLSAVFQLKRGDSSPRHVTDDEGLVEVARPRLVRSGELDDGLDEGAAALLAKKFEFALFLHGCIVAGDLGRGQED